MTQSFISMHGEESFLYFSFLDRLCKLPIYLTYACSQNTLHNFLKFNWLKTSKKMPIEVCYFISYLLISFTPISLHLCSFEILFFFLLVATEAWKYEVLSPFSQLIQDFCAQNLSSLLYAFTNCPLSCMILFRFPCAFVFLICSISAFNLCISFLLFSFNPLLHSTMSLLHVLIFCVTL